MDAARILSIIGDIGQCHNFLNNSTSTTNFTTPQYLIQFISPGDTTFSNRSHKQQEPAKFPGSQSFRTWMMEEIRDLVIHPSLYKNHYRPPDTEKGSLG